MINPKPVEGALRFARRIMFAMAYCCGHPRGGCPNHCDLLWAAIKRADEALKQEAALSAAPAPTAIPTVDEIAEAIADARLWKGSWLKMCEAERNVMRQGAEGVYSLLERRAAKEQADGQR